MAKNKFYRIFINGEVVEQIYYDYYEAEKVKNEKYPKGVVRRFDSEDEFKKELEKLPKHPKCLELDTLPSKDEIKADKQLKEEFIKKITDQVEEDERNGYTAIFTDGSYNEEKHLPSYSAIIYTSEKLEIKGVITEDKYKNQRNYAGEFFAVLETLKFCEEHNIKKPSFFVDLNHSFKEFYGCYENRSNNLNPLTLLFNKKIKEYKEKGFDMKFSWCPGHIGVPQNEAADTLAREAFDEYMAKNK